MWYRFEIVFKSSPNWNFWILKEGCNIDVLKVSIIRMGLINKMYLIGHLQRIWNFMACPIHEFSSVATLKHLRSYGTIRLEGHYIMTSSLMVSHCQANGPWASNSLRKSRNLVARRQVRVGAVVDAYIYNIIYIYIINTYICSSEFTYQRPIHSGIRSWTYLKESYIFQVPPVATHATILRVGILTHTTWRITWTPEAPWHSPRPSPAVPWHGSGRLPCSCCSGCSGRRSIWQRWSSAKWLKFNGQSFLVVWQTSYFFSNDYVLMTDDHLWLIIKNNDKGQHSTW